MANNINLELHKSNFSVDINNNLYNVEIDIPGIHFIYNSLCAISVGRLLGVNETDIINGILEFKLSKRRMEEKIITNNITLLIDCYNANYDSMKAALEVLGKYKTRKIAVLGDMLELGEYSEDLHKKIGKTVDENNIDILITVGNYSKYIYDNSNISNKYICKDNNEVVDLLNEIKRENDVILFKASNSMNFIEIVNNLK